MDTIFMSSENGKTSGAHRLLHNLTDNINLQRNDKYLALWYMEKHKKVIQK